MYNLYNTFPLFIGFNVSYTKCDIIYINGLFVLQKGTNGYYMRECIRAGLVSIEVFLWKNSCKVIYFIILRNICIRVAHMRPHFLLLILFYHFDTHYGKEYCKSTNQRTHEPTLTGIYPKKLIYFIAVCEQNQNGRWRQWFCGWHGYCW